MPRNVVIAVALPAPPDRLFDMYLDSKEHAAFTGLPATIAPHAGGLFRAFNGTLTGTILHVEPKRLIVQTWRSSNWPVDAMESVVVLSFWLDVNGGRIELNHINVPDEDFAGVSHGWEKYYWSPWRAYLAGYST